MGSTGTEGSNRSALRATKRGPQITTLQKRVKELGTQVDELKCKNIYKRDEDKLFLPGGS